MHDAMKLDSTSVPTEPVAHPGSNGSPKYGDLGEAKRRRLVGLLRGYFASPVIAALGEMGLADAMLGDDFSVSEWASMARSEVAYAVLDYLLSIGLLIKRSEDRYSLTPEGRTIVGRNGAFSLLMSYSEYFQQLSSLLAGADVHPKVDRLRNVRGSGQLHGRKFFPAAFDMFRLQGPTAIIDVGCGDGCFLEHARSQWPELAMFGVDLSETAVAATTRRLAAIAESSPIAVVANGRDVQAWGQAVPDEVRSSPHLIVSLWFVAHEFSEGSADNISRFFSELRSYFPKAQILLGELNKIPSGILAEDHSMSIMPEFLLFHALSGQGVLCWQDWQRIRENIPYTLKAEHRFDEVRPIVGDSTPANFVWLLEPK